MKRFANVGLLVLLSFGMASRAYGVATLMLDDGIGNSITIDNNGSIVTTGTVSTISASTATPGVISWNGTIGTNWTLNVSTGVSKPFSGSANNPKMDLNSINMSARAGSLTIKFSDNDFGNIIGGIFSDTIGGTTHGTLVATELYDPNNKVFQGGIISTLGPFVAGGANPDPFAFSGQFTTAPVAGNFAFSLTQIVRISHPSGGLTSFDYSKDATNPIPEPATLLLLGSGLVGFGYLRRRASKR